MRGHLKKRSKNSWSIVIDMGRDESGKRKQKWLSVKGTKKDAEKRLTEILAEIDTGTYIDSQKLTVHGYLKHWLQNHAAHNVGAKTFNRYSDICLKHLSMAFKGILLQKLHPLQITDYYTQALESGRLDGKGGLSPQTVKHHHRVLSEALKQAVKWQLIIRNPCDAVTPPKPAKKEMRALDKPDIDLLLKASSTTRINVPLEFTLCTGLRRGELLALKWSDLSWENGEIRINRSLEYTKKTGFVFKTPKTMKSRRSIPLPLFALDGLRRPSVKTKRTKVETGPDISK